MDDKYKLIIKSFGEERIKVGEKLAFHTYSKVGGTADCFFVATNQHELIKILDLAHQLELPFFIFGSGTKLLVSEQPINSLVIKNRTSRIKMAGVKGRVDKEGLGVEEALVEVDSGVSVGKLNSYLISQKLEEITGFSSLHSTIGGALFLDKALRERIQSIKIWEESIVSDIGVEELRNKDQIILSAIFKFKAALPRS